MSAVRHALESLQATRAKPVRIWALLLLLTLLAGLLPAGASTAQQAPGNHQLGDEGPSPQGSGQGAGKPKAEVFEPGPARRAPVGGPPASSGDPHLDAAGGSGRPGEELVGRRTENSRTVVGEDGNFVTEVFSGPMHYRDQQGQWQPIDNTLVPSEAPGYAHRNKANRYRLQLPADLGRGPVRFEAEGAWVSFALQGASGRVSVSGNTASYPAALAGVDVAYTAGDDGVKEQLVLADANAPTTFTFQVQTSPGLTAAPTPDGGIDFTDTDGGTVFSFQAPFMYDSSGAQGGLGAHSRAVSLRIKQASPQLVVELAADRSWVQAPERVFPLIIDPNVVLNADQDSFIAGGSFAGSNYGSYPSILVGKDAGGAPVRGVVEFYAENSFTEPVEVVQARLELYHKGSSGVASSGISVHQLQEAWDYRYVNWNARTSTANWASTGGTFDATPEWTNTEITITDVGWFYWWPTELVQGWLDGTAANDGLLVRAVNETESNLFDFASNQDSSGNRPKLTIVWRPLWGVKDPFTYEEFDLTPTRQALVNIASGNLTLREPDLSIAGTGLDATVERFYNSRDGHISSVGAYWQMWPQSEERLYGSNGDIYWQGGPRRSTLFSKQPDGSYRSPHGFRGTLTQDASGDYVLTFHETGLVYRFYPSGYPRQFVDRNGNKIDFAYVHPATGDESYLSSLTDSRGRVTSFERIGEHQVSKVTDPAGRTHQYAYDTSKRLVSYTDPAGGLTRYDYSNYLLTKLTDPKGNVATFAYDSDGRTTSLTRVTDPASGGGPTWSFNYTTPWQTAVTDPRANTTTYHFDRRGRVTKVVDALGRQRSAEYDSDSNVTATTSPSGAVVARTYDPNSNLTSSTLPTGASSSLEYANPAHPFAPTRYLTPQGNAISYDYDTPGNLKSITDSTPQAAQTVMAYNADGTPASSTDPNGNVTSYAYDTLGQLTTITPPAPLGATTIGYDSLSRVTSITDGKGQTRSYAYDALDRPTQITFADGSSVTYRYDAVGNLVERVDATGTTSYSYDALNRVVTEDPPGTRLNSYAYDGVGNLTSLTDVGGTVTYDYNAVNLLTALHEPGAKTTTFSYDTDNNRTSTTYPNGVTQTATYDTSNRVTKMEGSNSAGQVLTRFNYTYTHPTSGGDTSLRHTVADKDGDLTTYSYDAAERLVRALTRNPAGDIVDDRAYAYDKASNRTSDTINGTTTPSTYNAANQLTAHGAVTYSYDQNGNQTGNSAGQQLVYNPKDQTTSMKRPGGSTLPASYAGPHQFERDTVGSTTLNNTTAGINARIVSSGGVVSYTREPSGGLIGIRGDNTNYYYLFDGLASVAAVTDANGAVTNVYDYDPFGVTTETKLSGNLFNPWRYTSQYQDTSTGLYKIGLRYYQPELGRWTQPDPLRQVANTAIPADANPYAYAACNPVNYSDPTGAQSVVECIYAGFQAVVSMGGIITGVGLAAAGAAGSLPTFGLSAALTLLGVGTTGLSMWGLHQAASTIVRCLEG